MFSLLVADHARSAEGTLLDESRMTKKGHHVSGVAALTTTPRRPRCPTGAPRHGQAFGAQIGIGSAIGLKIRRASVRITRDIDSRDHASSVGLMNWCARSWERQIDHSLPPAVLVVDCFAGRWRNKLISSTMLRWNQTRLRAQSIALPGEWAAEAGREAASKVRPCTPESTSPATASSKDS